VKVTVVEGHHPFHQGEDPGHRLVVHRLHSFFLHFFTLHSIQENLRASTSDRTKLLIERKKTQKRRLQKLKNNGTETKQKLTAAAGKQKSTIFLLHWNILLIAILRGDAAPAFLPHRQKEACKELCFAVDRQTLKPFPARRSRFA
jgi:hypothetical protein